MFLTGDLNAPQVPLLGDGYIDCVARWTTQPLEGLGGIIHGLHARERDAWQPQFLIDMQPNRWPPELDFAVKFAVRQAAPVC